MTTTVDREFSKEEVIDVLQRLGEELDKPGTERDEKLSVQLACLAAVMAAYSLYGPPTVQVEQVIFPEPIATGRTVQ